METIELDHKLDFGKYKGEIVRSIIHKDPTYIHWNLEQNKKVYFGANVIAQLRFENPQLEISRETARRWNMIAQKKYLQIAKKWLSLHKMKDIEVLSL